MTAARSRPLRALRRAAIGALSVIALLVVAGLPVYVFPAQSTPAHSDVVFVIGPAQQWRLDLGRELVEDGHGDVLLVSAPAEDSGIATCDEPQTIEVICELPIPFTTQGEARILQRQMAEHGWTTATVITSTPHIVRTRMIMDRCVPDGVSVIGRSDGFGLNDWAGHYLYQTGAFLKSAFVTTGC